MGRRAMTLLEANRVLDEFQKMRLEDSDNIDLMLVARAVSLYVKYLKITSRLERPLHRKLAYIKLIESLEERREARRRSRMVSSKVENQSFHMPEVEKLKFELWEKTAAEYKSILSIAECKLESKRHVNIRPIVQNISSFHCSL